MQAMSQSWSAALVATESDPEAPALASRFLIAVALSAAYGLALGTREGGLALLVHAAAVPAAALSVTLLGVPALYIVLALCNAPIAPGRLAAAAIRAFATSAVVWAGLAPAVALFVVTSEASAAAWGVAFVGLAVGGLLGLRRLLRSIREQLEEADSATQHLGRIISWAFACFAMLLAGRVWSAALAWVGGVS